MHKGKYQGKYQSNDPISTPSTTVKRSRKRKAKRFPVLMIVLIILAALALTALAIRLISGSSDGNGIFSNSIITSHPESVAANVGDTVKFTVDANGEGLSYQWQWRESDSSDWTSTTVDGNKTSGISVPATIARHGYQYRCKITDHEGTVTFSNAATLTIKNGPTITGHPKNITAAAGETVQFSVDATGEGLKYQWQWRKNDASDWAATNVDGNRTAAITIPVTDARNGYQYRCVITDANGVKITSGAATLTVK